jgi:hypothetical protein
MQENLKGILFVCLLVFLSLPLFQRITHLFNESELQGAFIKPGKPTFSPGSISTMAFQKQAEDYENYSFGFRTFVIKFKNSVDYLLYKDISVTDQIEGKDGYIFSWGSVDRSITGDRYNGKEKNEATVEKIKFVKEEIEKRGGHFLTVFAPSKESIYPEKLPARYVGAVRKHSDHEELMQGFKKNNIPCIDFTAYFQKLKPTCPYPLFTKTGYHWSVYGASLAQDSLLSFIQHVLPLPMPRYIRTGVEFSDTARWPDADFERPMNLFFSLQDHRYVYPKLEMVQSTLKNHRPTVIIIGDSFFSMVRDLKKLQKIFSADSRFWYYFNESTTMTDDVATPVKNTDVISELESADFVILLGSLGTLGEYPYGFADYVVENASKVGIIGRIQDYIRNDGEWMAQVKEEAKVGNNPIESLITDKAKNIFRKRKMIHLKAANNKFICDDASKNHLLIADRDSAWAWETFTLVNFRDDRCAMYSFENKFVSTEIGHKTELTATRDAIAGWETFSMIQLENNLVAFRAVNGKYLTLDEKTQQLFATSDSISRLEKFRLVTE